MSLLWQILQNDFPLEAPSHAILQKIEAILEARLKQDKVNEMQVEQEKITLKMCSKMIYYLQNFEHKRIHSSSFQPEW